MSRLVTTEFGRLNHLADDTWLWECPQCKNWAYLSNEQALGYVRVGCPAWDDGRACLYHKKYAFGPSALAKMQSRVLMNESPYDEREM